MFDVVGEPDDVVGAVVQRHEGDVCRERRPDLLPDEFDQCGEVELGRDGLPDPIDRIELGDATAGLVDESCVLKGDAETRGERRQ